MRLIAIMVLAWIAAAPALARPPELRPGATRPVPERIREGEPTTARIVFADPDGDRPQELWVSVAGRGEPRRLPADLSGTETTYRSGVPVQWSLGALPAGRYQVHFETRSIDGTARYPMQGTLTLVVESLLLKWVLLGAGLLLALAVVPGIVYMGARRAADPAGAARTSLAIGVLAGYLWFLWLFQSIYTLPVFGVVGLCAAGLTGWIWLVRAK